MCFLVTFCTTQKVTSRFPCRELRGFPNLESAHPNNTLPRTKLNPFETFRFAESLSLPGRHTSCAFFAASRPLFRRPCRLFVLPVATDRRFAALLFPTFCIVQKVEQKNYSALRRYPCRDGTLRVLFEYFLHTAKSIYRKIPQIR